MHLWRGGIYLLFDDELRLEDYVADVVAGTPVPLTLPTRSTSLTLETRTTSLTLPSRSTTLTLEDRYD